MSAKVTSLTHKLAIQLHLVAESCYHLQFSFQKASPEAFGYTLVIFFFLSLAPQPSLGLGLLHKIRLNFLEVTQQFSFLQGRVVSPTLNLHPGGPGLCIYIPQRKGGYPF
jgi:hypothetical protein